MTQSGPCLARLSAALLLASAVGCSLESAAEVNPSDVTTQPAVDRVTAGTPIRKSLRIATSQPGRIEAYERAPLYPKIHGYVEEVLVDIGDPVEKGQILLRLWVPELNDDLQHKEALVARTRAEVQQAEAAARAAEAALVTARAKVAEAKAGTIRAEAEYERWKSEYDRTKDLVEREAVTPQLADEKQSQFRSADGARQEAAARVELAFAAVDAGEANLAKARADVVAAEAQLRVAEADLAHTATMLAYREIKAPFAGVVSRRHVDPGHYVQPANGGSSQPLLVVVRMDRVRVFVDVPEMHAALVDPGDPAVVYVQALGRRPREAAVTRTSWAIDASNRSLNTEIDLDNTDGTLRPGMYATAQIVLDARQNVLTLPVAAVTANGSDASCYCVKSGKLVRMPLVLGVRSGDDVEIIEGLDGEETVVFARTESLREGQRVEVAEPESSL